MMRVKKDRENAGLKLNIQKTKIMASGPITSWQIGKKWKQWHIFSSWVADSDCSHEIKRCLLLGRKATTNLESILKSRDIPSPTKVCIVKSYGFSSSHVQIWELDSNKGRTLKIWCFLTLVLVKTLGVIWTARRSNQSILKEISPESSLQGLMLKLKF